MLQDVTEVEGMARMGKIRGAGLTVAEDGPVEVDGQWILPFSMMMIWSRGSCSCHWRGGAVPVPRDIS